MGDLDSPHSSLLGSVPEWSIPGQSSGLSLQSNLKVKLNSKPKILLMGLSRSGKTSIRHVVFHKMSANETQFLDSTSKIDKIDISNKSFLDFQLWDFPGKLDLTHWQNATNQFVIENFFVDARVLIFVIDPRENNCAIERLHGIIMAANKYNHDIKIEVFIHKSDGLTDEEKVETIRELTHSINTKLVVSGHQDVYLSFRTTSIYDHSIFEAMSIVCQQLLENILSPFEDILNAFVSSNKMEKAFIFDVHPKIFLATDSSPFDMPTYELCCDMLDLIFDVGCIYPLEPGSTSPNTVSREHLQDADEKVYATCSVIKLTNAILHLKQINKYLALVCIEHCKETKGQLQGSESTPQGLIDYNFYHLRKGINKVLELASL